MDLKHVEHLLDFLRASRLLSQRGESRSRSSIGVAVEELLPDLHLRRALEFEDGRWAALRHHASGT